MKLSSKLWIILIVLASCTKDDNEIVHQTDSSLNQCFAIDNKYITDINSDGASGLFENFNNEYIFYSEDENQLIKIDDELNVIWKKTHSHLRSAAIIIEEITQNEDGEILILSTKLNEFSEVTKLTPDGDLIWRSKFQDSNNPQYRTILVGNNDGYIISGSVDNDDIARQPIVTKINEDGNEVWSNIITSLGPDIIKASAKTSDKYIVLGSTATSNNEVFYYFIDEDGNASIRTSIGNESGWLLNTISTSDNGFLALSDFDLSENQDLSNTDFQVVKVSNNGDIKWVEFYGGNNRDLPVDMVESKNGGYYLLGNSKSYGFGGYDLFLIKTDELGNVIWQNTYGTTERDFGGTIIETNNSDLIIVGTTGEDIKLFMMKVDQNGFPI